MSNISPREVGDLLASIAEDEHHTKGLSEISNQIEEYFRVNFRKLSFFDAKYIVTQLAKSDNSQKIQALDDKFWIWETLEEATRPNVD